MGRLTPVFGVLALFGFVALHACSSESTTDGKKGGGGGGSGGSGDGGDAGAPPSGGASGNTSGGSGATTGGGGTSTGGAGGAAGQAGEATGGVAGDSDSGGEGGSGAVGPGDACTMCMDGSAEVLQANCEETSPPCAAWKTCMRGCSDPECLDACDMANPDVAPYRFAIYEALCDSCATPCAALELCDRDCTDNVNLVPTNMPPATLAGTGLYASPTAAPDQVAAYARPFHPKYELWSDGALKRRWAYVPRCSRIANDGMNHWICPVGTRFWKEFTVPSGTMGQPGTRVETRFIHRYAATDDGWLYATYQWPMNNANPTAEDATLVDVAGVTNANGTQHDIPARAACPTCHSNGPGPFPDKALGFSAIQLSHDEAGVTLRSLADAGWLTFPAAAPGIGGGLARDGYNPPGTEAEQQALGYLHANCGNCHNGANTYGQNATAMTPPARMRLMVGSLGALTQTDTYASLVNVPTVRPAFMGCDRIEPGYPEFSEIVLRMGRRDVTLPGQQMPPLATEQVHTDALMRLRAWINAMPNAGVAPTTCTPPPL